MDNEVWEMFVRLIGDKPDLDSDEFGTRCHYCGADEEESEEWKAVCKNNGQLQDEYLEGVINYDDRFTQYRLAMSDPRWQRLEDDQIMSVLIHKDDCLWVASKRLIDKAKRELEDTKDGG